MSASPDLLAASPLERTTHLWLFFVLVFGVVLLPGMDMAFVVAKPIAGGRATGLAAVAGIATGGVCHVIMGATGVSVVLRLFPTALNALLLLGAPQFFVCAEKRPAWRHFRTPPSSTSADSPDDCDPRRTSRTPRVRTA